MESQLNSYLFLRILNNRSYGQLYHSGVKRTEYDVKWM